MRKNITINASFVAISTILVSVLLLVVTLGFNSNSNDSKKSKKVSTAIPKKVELESTTTTTIVLRETLTTIQIKENPINTTTQAQLTKCQAILDKAMNQIEAERQLIRTYEDATMTNNSEMAQIALNTDWSTGYLAIRAEYEGCWK